MLIDTVSINNFQLKKVNWINVKSYDIPVPYFINVHINTRQSKQFALLNAITINKKCGHSQVQGNGRRSV